jgi:PAS domain S-box-containing protein
VAIKNSVFSFKVILEKISALTIQIQQGKKLDEILQGTIADARSLLNTDRALIYRVLPNQDAFVAVESVGTEWTPILGQLIYDPCFEARWIERYQQGQTTSISDIHNATIDPCHVQLLERLQVQANLVVPILHQSTLWGLLIVHHCRSPRKWKSLEITYLQQVALHLGTAIQQAELRQSYQQLEATLGHYPAISQPSEPLRMTGTETNIPAREPAEKILPENDDRFRVMADCAPVLLWMAGLDGLCDFFNQVWLNFTGRSLEQERGNGWAEGVHPDDMERCLSIYFTAFKARQPFEMEYRLRRADGEYRWLLDHGTPRFLPDGEFAGFIGSCIDISDRKRIEDERQQAELGLRQRDEQMQAITANLPGYFIRLIIHADGSLSAPYISAGAASIYGLPIATLQADPSRGISLVHPDDRALVNAAIAAGVPSLTPLNLEYRIIDPTGQLKWIHGIGQFSRIDAGDTVLDALGFDITNKKQLEADRQAIEQALRQSQHQWYTLFHSLDDFLLVVDAADGRLLIVNTAMENRLGYSQAELLTMSVLDLHPPEQRQAAAQIVVEMLAGQRSLCTIPLMAKDGSYITVETKVKLDTWEGRPALLAICRDVSDRIAAEAALHQSEVRWQFALEGVEDGIWDWDLQTNTAFYSRQWKAMLGYTETDIADNLAEWDCRVHPDDRARSYALISEYLSSKTPLYQNEHRLRCKDGSYKWILARGKVIEWTAEGQPLRLIGTHTDMSDRKRIEKDLRESQKKYQTLFQILPIGISVTDAQGQVLEANPASEQILGLTVHEHTAHAYNAPNWHMIRPDGTPMPSTEYASVRALQENRFIHDVEMGMVCPDGTVRWISVSAAPIPLDQYGVAICYVDITDRKQLEKSLWLATFSLEQIAVSITWIDRHAKIRRVNAQFCNSLGYAREELLTMSIDQIDPNFPKTGWNKIWASIKQQKNMILETQHCTKQGDCFPVEVILQYIEFDGEEYSFAIAQDIRERLRTETQLRLQSTALDACADIIMITNKQGMIEWANPAFTQITGYSLEEAIGKNPRDLVKSGYQSPAFYQALWATILAGQTWRGELVNRRKDGSLYAEAETITPIYNQQNQISHFIAIKQDITEHKRLERITHQRLVTERVMNQIIHDMRQSLDLNQILHTAVTEVRQFLQTDRVIIYRLHPNYQGVVMAESVAPEWLATLNMEITDSCFVETQGDTYRDNHINVVSDVSAAELSPCHLDLLERLQVRAKLVVPIFYESRTWGLLIAHQCGSTREWQIFEVELMSQLAIHMTIAIQQAELYQQMQTLNTNLEFQVQERTAQLQQALDCEALLKRMTDQVRDSLDEAQILQHVVQELTIALKIEGCDAAIYDQNQTTTTVKYEYNQDGCIAQESVHLIANSSDPHLYRQLLQGRYCHFCLMGQNVVRPDQPQRTILACPIGDDQRVWGDMWLFKPSHEVFTDLEVRLVQQVATQCAIALRQSRLYQAAQTQVQELERLNRLKDDFLSTVSHELRSPMASIKMATQMIEISLKPLGILDDPSNAIQRYFKVLHEQGAREINLINDLLDLARLDAGTEPLNFITISLQFYIPHLAESLSERAHQQQQQLVFDIPEALPPVTTDLQYLERILTELLYNACKYTPAGGTIAVSAESKGEALEIRVSNSGVEIPAVECDRIFDKFYRIPNNDPWKHGGTGLGLALVKKFTERLGGQIHAESGGDQTTFVLKLASN